MRERSLHRRVMITLQIHKDRITTANNENVTRTPHTQQIMYRRD